MGTNIIDRPLREPVPASPELHSSGREDNGVSRGRIVRSGTRRGDRLHWMAKGFWISLGFLPVALICVFLVHLAPDLGNGLLAGSKQDWNSEQIEVREIQLRRFSDQLTGLGELENLTDQEYGFLNLHCDLLLDGELVDHESVVLSSIQPGSRRGFEVLFQDAPVGVNLDRLKVRVSVNTTLPF